MRARHGTDRDARRPDHSAVHQGAVPLMHTSPSGDQRASAQGVAADLERQPHLFMRLAENALIVAEGLRDNYFKNTAAFVSHLRKAMQRSEPILRAFSVADAAWADVQGEVVTF